MTKDIIICEKDNIAAVYENGKIVEFFMNEGEQLVGDIILGSVESTMPSIDGAFVNIGKNKNGFIHITDLALNSHPKKRNNIRAALQEKQKLLVQIVKEATSSKGPRLSGLLTIPGKYLILTPYERKIGISRKIEDQFERDRLLYLVKKLCQSGYGVVVRTEAQYQDESSLKEDLDFLLKKWSEILEASQKSAAPTILYRDQDLLYKVLRDSVTPDVKRIVVDSQEAKVRSTELLQSWSHDSFKYLQYNKNPVPLAIQFDLFNELEKALQTKVPLANGGYLIIEKTEAMTVIDVNSGGTKETNSLADTILRTNKDAALEIARQIRLRDIGGVIVVDFIDMFDPRDQQIVWQTLANATKNDKSQPQLGYFSEFSLLEITRHRQKKSLSELLTTKCPTCDGAGRLRNNVYRADMLDIFDSIRRRVTVNDELPKNERQVKIKTEELISNVDFFEKNPIPAEYEKYKRKQRSQEINFYHDHDDNRADNSSFEVVKEDTKQHNKHKEKHHHNHNHPHKTETKKPVVVEEEVLISPVEESLIENIDNIELDIIETEVILPESSLVNENMEKDVNEKDSSDKKAPPSFFELSPEERKYIQSIDNFSSRRKDKFKKDKRNFNDKQNRFEKNRFDDRNPKDRFNNSNIQTENREKTSIQEVSNIQESNLSNEDINLEPIIIPEILDVSATVLVKSETPTIVEENVLHISDTADTLSMNDEEVVIFEKKELVSEVDLETEEQPKKEVLEVKEDTTKTKKRGRKAKKSEVEIKEVAVEPEVLVKAEETPLEVLSSDTNEEPEVSDEAEAEDELALSGAVKKKAKFRKIRSFAPKKKKR
ncbi:MAG: Rne/Rng family ribonuclease [Candidatus Sericytochromatia bacterium]